MKKKHKNNENSEEESEEDEPMIKVEENRVYFHADVTRENCFKLIESIQKAQEYIAIRRMNLKKWVRYICTFSVMEVNCMLV